MTFVVCELAFAGSAFLRGLTVFWGVTLALTRLVKGLLARPSAGSMSVDAIAALQTIQAEPSPSVASSVLHAALRLRLPIGLTLIKI